jgi:tetratricopeptide (TPR) repeat protein
VRQAEKPRLAPPERRIIERPRLLKQLEETDAKTILLVAPAGYGKTTLARQWADRRVGAWLAGARAGTDLTTVARELANGLSRVGTIDSDQIEEVILATPSRERQAAAIARALVGESSSATPECWLFIDDYHLLPAGGAIENLILALEASGRFRLLLTSRGRPEWATTRRRLYGEILELGQADLALTHDETAELVPAASHAESVLRRAQGWPALVGLLAVACADRPDPETQLPSDLYDFLAEDVYARASAAGQEALLKIALLPSVDELTVQRVLRGREGLSEADATGLVQRTPDAIDVHPLARDFLFDKVRERQDVNRLTRASFSFAIRTHSWDHAFLLVEQFGMNDRVDELITSAYADLVESGRIETLQRFGQYAARFGGTSQAVLDLIDAEVALRDGLFNLASARAQAAAGGLPTGHGLQPRSYLVAASGAHLSWQLDDAYRLFGEALPIAQRPRDLNSAAWGRCLAALYLEDDRLRAAVEEFGSLLETRAEDRLRLLMARQHLARLTGELSDMAADRATALVLLGDVRDPVIRTGWGNTWSYTLMLQAEYVEALAALDAALEDVDKFELEFARPHLLWTRTAALLGLRRFHDAGSTLSIVENFATATGDTYLELNVRALHARLLLTQQRASDALGQVEEDFESIPTRAMYGEYLATRALAYAVSGDSEKAAATVRQAVSVTEAVETRMLTAAATAVRAADRGDARQAVLDFIRTAAITRCWDGVVCALRASRPLLNEVAGLPDRECLQLRKVLDRLHDRGLANALGGSKTPELSPQPWLIGP